MALRIASYYRTIVLEQGIERARSDGYAPMVEHHHPNVFHRDGALGLLFEHIAQIVVLRHLGQTNNQLALMQT